MKKETIKIGISGKYRITKIKPGYYGYKTIKPFKWGLEIDSGRGFGFGLLTAHETLKEAQASYYHCIGMDKYLEGEK